MKAASAYEWGVTMFASPVEILILNLGQDLPKHFITYMSKQDAYEELKRFSGKDFGFDAEKWMDWARVNGLCYPRGGDERLRGS